MYINFNREGKTFRFYKTMAKNDNLMQKYGDK